MTRLHAFRRAATSAIAAAFALVAAIPFAHSAELQVTRIPDAGSFGVHVQRGAVAQAGSAPRLDIAKLAAARAGAWRQIPDVLSHPKVDWSPRTARRSGWRTPLGQLERTHRLETNGVEAALPPLGPPDTLRVAFIRIDFARDRGGDASTGDGRFDLSRPGAAAPPIDRPPHNRGFYLDHLEALKRYYVAQSYGRTVVVGDVWPRTQNGAYSCTDMADLGPWKFSTSIYGAAVQMFRTMMFAADTQSTQSGDRIPWDQYDRFVLIHAGSDLQSDVSRNSEEDIPSFTIGVGDTDGVIFRDSTAWNRAHPIDRAALIPEHINQDGYFGAINGVLAHECGHLFFGFVDLYNVDSGYPAVGLWSLMDSGNLAGSIVALADGSDLYATGLLPPSVDPWQRAFTTDVLRFPEAAYGDTMAIRNSERNPDMRRVSMSSDEYLILENRWLAPSDSVSLDQADSSRVILGPKSPDRFEYDALLPVRVGPDGKSLPGCGVLAWHIDESVIPSNEFTFPCDTARANRECGFNTNPLRLAISILEADGLQDLGDGNSPYILGAPRDPWFRSNNASLGDSTRPRLTPHIGTYPHIRLDFIDDPDSVMHVAAFRTWQLPGWPVPMPFPAAGPQPLAIDVDGDRLAEICWAGGPEASRDSASVIVVRASGAGLLGPGPELVQNVGRLLNPVLAAIQRDVGAVNPGPAVIAVSTLPGGVETNNVSGRVWLIDHTGAGVAGWPALLPSQVTTAPVIATAFSDTFVYVGCADGRVYALRLDGTIAGQSQVALAGGVAGRLAVFPELLSGPTVQPLPPANPYFAIAAGGAQGDVTILAHSPATISTTSSRAAAATTSLPPVPASLVSLAGWPRSVGGAGFTPDFLFINFAGRATAGTTHTPPSGDCFDGALSLIVHHGDVLSAYCLSGAPIQGWGGATGDTIVAGLGAGDPDGDGFPEVITQSISSGVSYWNVDGHPSPGWPRRGTRETFRTGSPPLAIDLNANGRTQTIAMNASGIVDAFDLTGKEPQGWPLASGLGARGAPVLADLNGDRFLELVVPDANGLLYAYSLPTSNTALAGVAWPMLGGDAQRSGSLPSTRTPLTVLPASGPLVRGSFKAYPNPARRKPVTFAYRMTEPGDVEFRILDTSGHEVAAFSRRARQSDNLEVWDPGALPAGLYMARLRFRGASSDQVETVPVGLLR